MVLIICTGTPGTGKTTVSKKVAKLLGYDYLYIGDLVKKFKLGREKDKKFNSTLVNVNKLNSVLIKLIKNYNNLVLDGHLSHYLPSKYVDLCIVTRCDLKKLKRRLEKNKYSKIKIRENLDSEIFDVCFVEALELGHNVVVVDTTQKVNFKKLVRILGENLKTCLV